MVQELQHRAIGKACICRPTSQDKRRSNCLEIKRGFEVKQIRRKFRINRETEFIAVELEKVLHWREEGWVAADSHVHFLAPATAMLEAPEGRKRHQSSRHPAGRDDDQCRGF